MATLNRPDDASASATALQSRWTEVAGWHIHVLSGGELAAARRPVLLLHGIGMSSRDLRGLALALASDFQVFVPDQPGFGDSDKPRRALELTELGAFVVGLMDALGFERAALLGNSFGCGIAVEVAVTHPERVDGLVLQGLTPEPHARTALRHLARWLANVQREPFHGQDALAEYRRAGFRRVARTFRSMLRDPIEEKLPRVQAPTLVVRGSKDPIVPQKWAEHSTRLLPHGRLTVVPGAAHSIHRYQTAQLAKLVRPFLLDLSG